MKKISIILIALIVSTLLVAIFVSQLGNFKKNDPLIGQPISLPEGTEFRTLQANTIISPIQLFSPNKLTLLNLWAAWCPSCAQEMPALHQMKAMGWRIIGIDFVDNKTKAKAFLKKHGNPFEFTLFDPDGLLGIHLGASGTPESFLLDQKGIIRYRHIGVINQTFIKNTLPRIVHNIKNNTRNLRNEIRTPLESK